ncbi:MAG: hypothetical protein E6Q97_23190 [Desulfurellales bacterium]|nr:MAG: hypothetical protein E6Q97_23190 [Desulfurellales bacterium]
MPYSTVIRTLRDGSVQIKDGSSPVKTCTIACDEGDLNWREQNDVKVIKCRGVLTGVRQGDKVPCELNLTMKWAMLVAFDENSSNPIMPYEMINNVGSNFTSTESGAYCLQWVFTVAAPSGVAAANGEIITFNDVWKTSLDCREGDEANTLAFSGMMLNEAPTITSAS